MQVTLVTRCDAHRELIHVLPLFAFIAYGNQTWDTIALFLPLQYGHSKPGGDAREVDEYVKRRLRLIARACFEGGSLRSNDIPWSLLDVGCGDGSAIPYLLAEADNHAMPTWDYLGLDVSQKMIDLGQAQYPAQTFVVGSFPQGLPVSSPLKRYDCILFNGSLQFFRDTLLVLRQAAELLKSCAANGATSGRIVVAHVNGARFVSNECRTNPTTAVQSMPSYARLKQWADDLGLVVLSKADLFPNETLAEHDGNGQSFYLYALTLNDAGAEH
jgi:SAM-dependent methyltransferase